MPCYPSTQLYDGSRPDYTNRGIFSAPEGGYTEVTAYGLSTGQSIPLLVKDTFTDEYVPYTIDGQPVVLTYENPTVLVEGGNTYKLDTSTVAYDEDISVTTREIPPRGITSELMMYKPYDSIVSIPVEVVRTSENAEPIVYRAGTSDRIMNPVGTFSCCSSGGQDSSADEYEFLMADTLTTGRRVTTNQATKEIVLINDGPDAELSQDGYNWYDFKSGQSATFSASPLRVRVRRKKTDEPEEIESTLIWNAVYPVGSSTPEENGNYEFSQIEHSEFVHVANEQRTVSLQNIGPGLLQYQVFGGPWIDLNVGETTSVTVPADFPLTVRNMYTSYNAIDVVVNYYGKDQSGGGL